MRFVLGGSGHIAGIVNPPAANKYGYWTREDTAKHGAKPRAKTAAQDQRNTLPATADAWFSEAEKHEGSWWTDWQAWATAHDAAMVPARDPAKGKLKVLEDAPGSYVKQRL